MIVICVIVVIVFALGFIIAAANAVINEDPLLGFIAAGALGLAIMWAFILADEIDKHNQKVYATEWFIENHDPLTIERLDVASEEIVWINSDKELCEATLKDGIENEWVIINPECKPYKVEE